ncbi:MAG TPA: hypothetical protein VK037_04600, partial [Pseudogracilibacillus sp.]|nr:hypothetical protein [Pseudogracilibacillus sp.]
MKRAHNEKGYTLFLVVLMIVVFSVISMSLITVTISGAKRSEVRENVTQAGELAEKGLNRLVQQIRADIQAEIPEEGLSKEDFIQTINKVKERYKCEDSTTSLVQSETGKYGACINLNDEGLNKSEDAIPHKLLLNTIGESNEKEKELEAVVEIDGNAIPDKMAVTTFIRDECTDNINKCHDGEGNLFLSGFVGIQGHLNVDRYLITSNRSYQKYAASHHWIQSYFPAVLKQEDGSQSEIIVGEKDFYRMAWDPKAFKGTLMTKLNDNYLEYNEHIKLTHNIKDELPYRKMDAITDEL